MNSKPRFFSQKFIPPLWDQLPCVKNCRNCLRLINTSQSRQKSFLVILYNYLAASELKKDLWRALHGVPKANSRVEISQLWHTGRPSHTPSARKIISKYESKQSMSLKVVSFAVFYFKQVSVNSFMIWCTIIYIPSENRALNLNHFSSF